MIPVSNVVNTQSFGTWEQKTNQLASLMSSNVVTADNSASGSLTTGNVQVNGFVAVTNLAVGSLMGGNNTANANLVIGTNTVIQSGLTTILTVSGNSSGSNVYITANSISFGPTSIITSAIASTNTIFANIVSTNTSVNIGANVSLSTTELTIGNSTVNAQVNSTIYSGTSNNSNNLGGHGSSYYANVTSPVFTTSANVGSNVSLSTSGLSIGNSSVNSLVNSTTFTGTAWSANNATNLGGTAAAGYQTTAGLAANVALLSANYATFSGNSNNSAYLGGVAANGYVLIASPIFTGNIEVGANVIVSPTGLSIGNSTANVQINSTAVLASNLVIQAPLINTIGNVALNGALFANGLAGLDGMVLTTSGDGSNVFWMGIQGNGTIGGTNATIQFANNGDFDGDANLTYSPATHTLYIGNTTLTPGNVSLQLNATTIFLGNATVNLVMNSTFITSTNLVANNAFFKGVFPDGNRNRIINGQFLINQYNNYNGIISGTVAFSNQTSSFYLQDRWYMSFAGISNTGAQFFYGQSTPNLPQQFASGFGFTCGVGGFTTVSGSSPSLSIRQKIEQFKLRGFNIGYANCLPMVLSFWVYPGDSGTYGGAILANTYSFPFTYTVTGGQWNHAVVNVAPLTTGGNTFFATNSSSTGLIVSFEHIAMANQSNPALAPSGNTNTWSNNSTQYICPKSAYCIMTGTNNNWYITGVQLEAGNYPSQYEYQTETQEYFDCFRYYYNPSTVMNVQGYAQAAGVNYNGQVINPVPMRNTPSLSIVNNVITNVKNITSAITNTGATITFSSNAAGAFQYSLFSTILNAEL